MPTDHETYDASFWRSSIHLGCSSDARLLFMYMLALKDAQGVVKATPQHLASVLNYPPDLVASCLAELGQPDEFSSSLAEDGRRVLSIGPNRWRVVNHAVYNGDKIEPDKGTAQQTERVQANNEPAACVSVPTSTQEAGRLVLATKATEASSGGGASEKKSVPLSSPLPPGTPQPPYNPPAKEIPHSAAPIFEPAEPFDPATAGPDWWVLHPDPVVKAFCEAARRVPKFSQADLVPERVQNLVDQHRPLAPDDQAILREIANWEDYNTTNRSRGGKSDPVRGIYNWFGKNLARWKAEKQRGSGRTNGQHPRPNQQQPGGATPTGSAAARARQMIQNGEKLW